MVVTKKQKDKAMSIGLVQQSSGNSIMIYDEKGHYRCTIPGTLLGYTSLTVSVKNGSTTMVYDENGHYLFSR